MINLLYTWRNFFRRYDLDRNGIIETYALVNILNSLRRSILSVEKRREHRSLFLGFNLSPVILESIVKRYAIRIDEKSSPKISFEHYVQLCARLTMLTGE